MKQVRIVTEQLIDAIAQSDEYISYQQAKKDIEQYPVLKAKVDEFRRRNYELQNSYRDVFEEGDRLQQEFQDIFLESVVRKYLKAENALCRVIQQVNWQIIESLDFDINLNE